MGRTSMKTGLNILLLNLPILSAHSCLELAATACHWTDNKFPFLSDQSSTTPQPGIQSLLLKAQPLVTGSLYYPGTPTKQDKGPCPLPSPCIITNHSVPQRMLLSAQLCQPRFYPSCQIQLIASQIPWAKGASPFFGSPQHFVNTSVFVLLFFTWKSSPSSRQ